MYLLHVNGCNNALLKQFNDTRQLLAIQRSLSHEKVCDQGLFLVTGGKVKKNKQNNLAMAHGGIFSQVYHFRPLNRKIFTTNSIVDWIVSVLFVCLKFFFFHLTFKNSKKSTCHINTITDL
jgi:hypothetical protein